MQRKRKGNIEWLEFNLLSNIPGLFHGVFLKHGGEGPSDSLTVGSRSSDHFDFVKKNLQKVRDVVGVPLCMGKQVHRTTVVQVSPSNIQEPEVCDGLMTDRSRLGLLIKHADCQAAIFYDPIHRAVANVHCGWRGNVQNIYRETINKMKETYGTDPRDLLVCISPSLGPEASEFKNFLVEWPEPFWVFQFKPTYFDLWAISRFQLEEEGVLSHHIEIAGVCTYSNPNDFFSYRRDKECGNNATVVALKT